MRCLLCCFFFLHLGSVLAQSGTWKGEPPPSVGNNPHVHKGKWDPNGHNAVLNADKEIWQDGLFKNGALWEGTVYFYESNGVLADVKVYRNGESVKPAVPPVASDTLNRKDSLQRKQGHWIYYGKNRPESGIPDDGKVEEGRYVNDRKEGKWIKYHDDGVHPKIIGYYQNNRPKGVYEKFYISGQLKEKGNFERNMYTDTLTRYNEDGMIEYQAVYSAEGKEEALLHGEPMGWPAQRKEYSTDCAISVGKEKAVAADTLNRSDEKGRQGHWIYYGRDRPGSGIPPDGKVEEGYYVDDRKEGVWIKYHDDGKTPKLIGRYENNRPHGHYDKYNTDGSFRDSGDFSMRHTGGYPVRRGGYEYDYRGQPVEGSYRAEIEPAGPTDSLKLYPPQIIDSPATRGIKFQPNSYNKIYNNDNEIWLDGIFKNGQLSDGKVYFYDPDGILLGVSVYRDGKYLREGQL